MPATNSSELKTAAAAAWWRLPVLLAIVMVAIVLGRLSGCFDSAPQERSAPAKPDAAGRTVSLAIKFGDGSERQFDNMPWHEGMTVADAMGAASHVSGGIEFAAVGNGASALLSEIDKVANEGGDGRNWTYSVNDEQADRSYAVYELKPNDRVLWTFGTRK